MATIAPIIGTRLGIYAEVTADNRIHLWDVAARRERGSYVEKNHLSHRYTCSALFQGKDSNYSLGIFAVGNSDGSVFVWDLARGVVVRKIDVASGNELLDLAFSNNGDSIFVATVNDQDVGQYNILTGSLMGSVKTGKRGCNKIAVNPKVNVLAVAGSGIRIVDVETGAKKKLTSTVRGTVSVISFSPCGRYLVCCGTDSREILLFDIQEGARLDARSIIAVDGYVSALYCQSSPSKDIVDILCLFKDKGGCVVRVALGEDKTNDEFTNDIVSISKIKPRAHFLSGCFSQPLKNVKPSITLVLGLSSQPSFHQVDIEAVDGILLPELIIQSLSVQQPSSSSVPNPDSTSASIATTTESSSSLNQSSSARPKDKVILGVMDTGGVKRTVIEIEETQTNSDPSKKQKISSNAVDVMIDPETAEQTLEQRLEALSSSLSLVEQQAVKSSKSSVPTSDSLVTIIEQALQSGDNALLEQCLMSEDSNVIEETCRRLPTGKVITFLKRLVSKFEKSPSRGILLTKWLSSLLKHHTAFLISTPDLAKQLGGLSQMLESRLESYTRLSSLSGRLDLLMTQLNSSGTSLASRSSATPKQIYIEE